MSERAVGIDISKYQKRFDIDDAKEPIHFVFQRGSYGTMKDELYDELWPGVREFRDRVGPIGAFHYFSTGSPWKDQAQKFLSIVGNRGYGRFALDYEHYYNNLNEQSAIAAGNWVDYIQQATGRGVLLYCGIYHLRDHLDPYVSWHRDLDLWISRWPGETVKPQIDNPDLTLDGKQIWPADDWKVWQYIVSKEGDRYGTAHAYNRQDLDVFNGTVPKLWEYFGYNQEPEPEPPADCTAAQKAVLAEGIMRLEDLRDSL